MMIFTIMQGLEKLRNWFFAAIFFIAGIAVAIGIPSSQSQSVSCILAVVLFHTAAMIIVGFTMGYGKKGFWGASWIMLGIVFMIAAILFS